MVADILPARPVRLEKVAPEALLQRLLHEFAVLVLTLFERAGEQAVRQERVGPPPERPQVQQRQAVRRDGVAQMSRQAIESPGAVLALEVLGQTDTFGRDRRVQLERGESPAQAGSLVAELIERPAPARRADIAPRSDDVGPDDDVDHGLLLVTRGRTMGAFPGCGRDSPPGRRRTFGRSSRAGARRRGETDRGRS
jgi:hypothetical protein